VALSFDSRRVGDIAVVTCRGRIVEGEESNALQRHVNGLLPFGSDILMDLGGVEFIDSSGLGLLVRLLIRIRAASGSLQLCAPTPRIREVLRVTKLSSIFESHETEAEAIAAFYQRPRPAGTALLEPGILCVDKSTDVLAYVREILKQAGYAALTTVNLADALTLFRATAPRLIIVGADLRGVTDTRSADTFNRLIDSLPVIELPRDFSSHEAGEAGRHLLDDVRNALGARGNSVQQAPHVER
jgi:anti-sigma B factor antagonist